MRHSRSHLDGRLRLKPQHRPAGWPRLHQRRTGRQGPARRSETHRKPIDSTTVSYTVETASDGSFSVGLPPGGYKLTGSLTTQITGGQTSPQDVYISTGKTTTVEVYAIYP